MDTTSGADTPVARRPPDTRHEPPMEDPPEPGLSEWMIDPDQPGQPVQDKGLIAELKEVCRVLSNTNRPYFPGSQPVSLLPEHLNTLKFNPFLVCEKTDGVRYLLLIHTPMNPRASITNPYTNNPTSTFLVDRKFQFYPIPALDYYIGFKEQRSMLNNTLVDGEVTIDVVHDPETNTPRKQSNFYVFDSINIRTNYVGGLSLKDRLRVAKGEFIHILWSWISQTDKPDAPPLPFNVLLKRMYDKSQISFVFDTVMPALPHENDGLIFTQDDVPYIVGTCQAILKWKPLELNSVDFFLEVIWAKSATGDNEKRYCKLSIANRGVHEIYGFIHLSDEDQSMLMNKYDGRGIVIEVVKHPEWPTYEPPKDQYDVWSNGSTVPTNDKYGGWKFHRVREDKKIANDVRTLRNVMRSIESGITQTTLTELLN